jgi:alpha/beta superfamily hydrolase
VQKLVNKLSQQRDIKIDYRVIPGANHFFTNYLEQLSAHLDDYLGPAVANRTARRTAG